MPLVGGAPATVAEPSASALNGTGIAPALSVATPPPELSCDPLDEPSGHPAGPEAPTDEVDRSALSRALRRSVELAAGPVAQLGRASLVPAPSTDRAPHPLPPGPFPPAPAIRSPHLIVVRGERPDVEYRVVDGRNYIGRSTDRGVDIDLTGQEAVEQTWTSRQHAVLTLDRGTMMLEDLNSLNGTFVNRTRLHPGQQRALQHGDVIQVGTVQLRVVF